MTQDVIALLHAATIIGAAAVGRSNSELCHIDIAIFLSLTDSLY
jgi:hypothetical protein